MKYSNNDYFILGIYNKGWQDASSCVYSNAKKDIQSIRLFSHLKLIGEKYSTPLAPKMA